MKIKYFCPLWGSDNFTFHEFVKKVKNAGYDGIEMSLPLDKPEQEAILKIIKEYDLLLIAQHWETVNPNFEDHKKEYRKRIDNLVSSNPVLLNTQTGRDFFTFDQNAELISLANQIAKNNGIKLVHETHRGKFSFAAHIVAGYINKIPDLRLGFDVSHWCNVAETFLDDQQRNVDLAISRTDHIHARVGFPEGPQIPDPRVPEWKEAVDIHMKWWTEIIHRNQKEGKDFFTITTEFGPFPYMTMMPFTQQPISNQWDINVYMMNLLKEKFD